MTNGKYDVADLSKANEEVNWGVSDEEACKQLNLEGYKIFMGDARPLVFNDTKLMEEADEDEDIDYTFYGSFEAQEFIESHCNEVIVPKGFMYVGLSNEAGDEKFGFVQLKGE